MKSLVRLIIAGVALWAVAGRGAEPAAAAPTPLQNWPLDQLFALDLTGGRRATLEGQAGFSADPVPALVFDGTGSRLSVPEVTAADLPKRDITVECCVALDAPQPWGGLVGYLQDNGDYEKGWLLGYVDAAFCFALSTHGKLTYLKAPQPAVMGRWYHLAGVYDGQTMRLYVNGRLEGTSAEQSGDIDYPPKAVYTIGAYRDDNENFLLKGRLKDIRLFDRALGQDWVQARAESLATLLLEPVVYGVPPRVLYLPGGAAEVIWDLPAVASAVVEYGRRDATPVRQPAAAAGTHFAVRLDGLAREAEYTVRIHTRGADGDRVGAPFTFDTTFNYGRPPVPAEVAASPLQATLAERLVPDPDQARGICLVYGLADGRLALEIARRSHYRVLAWDDRPEQVASVRRFLLEAGVYGQQVTVQQAPALAALPVAGGIADLVVSEALAEGRLPGSILEVLRLLRPGGGRAELGPLSGGAPALAQVDVEAWLAPSPTKPLLARVGEQTWASIIRPSLAGAGAWTHQYGDAGNSANSWDTLQGATGAADFDTQWIGRPGADFGIDRNPRMPAPLVANGRLFHQGLNRIAALNAFNGTILWTMELSALRRVNIPRDAGNWCADDASLFVAMAGSCLQLDAATGAEQRVFHLPDASKVSTHEWGWLARAGGVLLGSSARRGAAYREFWGGDAWYDGRTGVGTEKVCSDDVFALDVAGDQPTARWVQSGHTIINSTLAAVDGMVVFAESRNPALATLLQGRLGDELWQDLWVVCLDLETGRRRWETAIEGRAGTTVFFLSAVPGAIVLTASTQGEYRLTCLEPASGAVRWSAAHPWPSDNHGGHMQHPVLSAATVFLEPHAYDLKSGTRQPGDIGRHEGCATYAGTAGALLYRGLSRCVALWDIRTGQVTTWRNLRPSCWLNTVAGCGLILIPEGGGGCSCGTWLEASLGFAPHQLQQGAVP